MKKRLLLAACVIAGTGHAQGIDGTEYQKLKATSECAFIANTMKPGVLSQETVDKTFNVALQTLKKDTPLLTGTAYTPSPETLAIDFAIHYQQMTSDVNDDMLQAIHAQGLPLAPESWFTIAAQFWMSRNCALVVNN